MNFFNETIRMFFATSALLLVGLLSTPNLDLESETQNPTLSESKQSMQEMLPKSVQNALSKEKKISLKKAKAKRAESKKLAKRVIILKKS